MDWRNERRTSWYGSPTAIRRYGPGSFLHGKLNGLLSSRVGRVIVAIASGLSDGAASFGFCFVVAFLTTIGAWQLTDFFEASWLGLRFAVVLTFTLSVLDVVCTKAIIAEALVAHARELGVNKRRLVVPGSYGTEDTARWEKEKQRFVTTVLLPKLGPRSRNVQWAHLYLAIDDVADDAIALLPKHRFDPDMDPFDYEHLCAELLVDAGWSAHATKASGDQGADVLAERDGERAVLQCKLYSSPVGNKAVQEVHAARGHYQAKWAVAVSNQTYTPSASELAQSLGVHLVHHDELGRLAEIVEAS